MSDHYVFQTQAQAQACLDYINSTPWFPIIGQINGQPALDAQATTCWAEAPLEMLTGEWAVPRIPETRLDYVGVPQAHRNAFLQAFGSDIRDLSKSDFVQITD
jgi:hypothetical protein